MRSASTARPPGPEVRAAAGDAWLLLAGGLALAWLMQPKLQVLEEFSGTISAAALGCICAAWSGLHDAQSVWRFLTRALRAAQCASFAVMVLVLGLPHRLLRHIESARDMTWVNLGLMGMFAFLTMPVLFYHYREHHGRLLALLAAGALILLGIVGSLFSFRP
jgi:multisubunit Na+/H+ antiporter MnhG subunit